MVATGIVPDHFDRSIRPQDDLFSHVNGAWLEGYAIPPDRSSDGAFRELHDQAERQVRTIVEAARLDAEGKTAESHEERLIAALYASFMETDRIEALGAAALAPDLSLVAGVETLDDLARVLGRFDRTGVGGVFDVWVDTDPGDPTRYIVNLGQGGLGLPDEAYYRQERHADLRAQYADHVAALFALAPEAGGPEPAEAARRVVALETALAAQHWDVVKDRDDTLTYNPMALAALKAQAPGFPWDAWAAGLAAPAGALDNLVVREPDFFIGLAGLWPAATLEDWRLWLRWHVLHARAPYLSEAFTQENFNFYGRVLSGTEEIRLRWKRAVSFVQGCVGEAVGRRYVARHFPADSKRRMLELTGNLIAAYRQSIEALAWLGEETKAKALLKLEQFTPKIGYPDRWRDYAALAADPADLLGNVRAAAAFETDRDLGKIGQPVDRTEWFMTPQTVNAYYNPGLNEIVFPAAILQAPFFDPEADDAANYGGIGAVIGHEIGHGFDDQGSKYDGTGALVDWWTAADRAAFEERTKALIKQYDGYVMELPDGSQPVNGALTIGENIGDLGGLAIAWKAYLLELGGAVPPELDGLTAAQRFFFGWAQCWRAKTRPEEAAVRLTVDPHSPDRFRCNGVVRNLDEFHTAFAVEPGDGLYLPPEQRVAIW
ncbi:MAG: peptidase M13 [Propionibacteriaceae bacterium]|jgi:putative endopeptidase|nr:peptidase M13 [Propionibacteriaceae bacterium]